MGDWPQRTQDYNGITISTMSSDSVGGPQSMVALGAGSAAWGTANKAIYVPFRVLYPLIAVKLFTSNGSTASGNLDIGIYDDQGNYIISSGSTAQAGTSALQTFDITDTLLLPGIYYFGLSMNGTTGTTFRASINLSVHSALGVLVQASAFPLPTSTATFAANDEVRIPVMGLTTRTVV